MTSFLFPYKDKVTFTHSSYWYVIVVLPDSCYVWLYCYNVEIHLTTKPIYRRNFYVITTMMLNSVMFSFSICHLIWNKGALLAKTFVYIDLWKGTTVKTSQNQYCIIIAIHGNYYFWGVLTVVSFHKSGH